ncbi:hypothetical protein DV532_29980 (plasmid) [Pseudomonas sp. Leaf58]|uniref:hypothetical protein n=1 Tax=Pseudomonas sp. Leaf58 TaxID=1736226 RepID=UPI000A8B2DE1|nr:hypothetical protein [Pseudomonas sp. Leaf58]AYG48459.1 hypothetical protein DV532_29980 [Pseudomonas sp. Leaf58]
MSDKSETGVSKRGRGRPRLQPEPCTVRIGVPLTADDNEALLGLVELSCQSGNKVSKQEIIREMIRERAAKAIAPLHD